MDALPSNGIYGNDVMSRAGLLDTTSTPLTWIDTAVSLPAGTLLKYYVYANHSNTAMTSRLRLQVWRPASDPDSVVLIWERQTMVNLTYPDGALYVVNRGHSES